MRWPKRRKERREIERLIARDTDKSFIEIWEALQKSNLSWDVIVPGMFGIIDGWRMKNEL